MRLLAILVVSCALAVSQALDPSSHELLRAARPLTSREIAIVLTASQRSFAARTFRLSYNPGQRGIDVLMGLGGRPRMIPMKHSPEGRIVGGIGPGKVRLPTQTPWREDISSPGSA